MHLNVISFPVHHRINPCVNLVFCLGKDRILISLKLPYRYIVAVSYFTVPITSDDRPKVTTATFLFRKFFGD